MRQIFVDTSAYFALAEKKFFYPADLPPSIAIVCPVI